MNDRSIRMPLHRPSSGSRVATIVLGVTLFGCAAAANETAAATPAGHALDIHGQGFAFSVTEPAGWLVDSGIAPQFAASVIFYPVDRDPRSSTTPLIRIVTLDKSGAGVARAMSLEAGRYRERNATLRTVAASAPHPRYPTSTRRFCMPDGSCDYVTFLDPGPDSRVLLAVTMHRPATAANAAELDAYRRIVASAAMAGSSRSGR